MPETYCAVVLAAGEGKRMKSNRPKVLCEVLFKPMLRWVLDAVRASAAADICCVAGFRHEQVEAYLKQLNAGAFSGHPVSCVLQQERRGTGHAVMMARTFLEAHRGGHVLVLNGDAPFLSAETIDAALQQHRANAEAVTVISAEVENPFGYGRILRDEQTGLLQGIVEQKDADSSVQRIREINSGSYWFCVDSLLEILSEITSDNAQGEYYLTDAVKLLLAHGQRAGAYVSADADAVLGANDCVQLAELNTIARRKILQKHMEAGVSIPCTDGVIIGPDVAIGSYSCILPGSILQGTTSVGAACTVGPEVVLRNARIADGVSLCFVQVYNQQIANTDSVESYHIYQ